MSFKRMSALGAVVLFGVSVGNLRAQDGEAVCLAMVSDAAHNVSIDTSSEAYYHMYYSNYCNEDGSTNDSSISASGSAIINAIPVSLKGQSTDAHSQWSKFCSTEHEKSASASSSYAYQSLVVSQALASANQCLRIVKDHAYTMTYKVMTPDTLVVNFGIPSGQNIVIHGVKADEATTCTGSNLSKGGSFAYKEGIGQTVSASDGSTSISCIRKPFSTLSGTSYYKEGAVEVDTNVGQMNIFWPQLAILPLTTASAIQTQINMLKAEVDFNQLPMGTILPWFNRTAPVPKGWTKCDGSDTGHCPDLSGMFLRGSAQGQIGSTGGSATAEVGQHGSNHSHGDGNGWNKGGSNWWSDDHVMVTIIPPYTSVLYIPKISDQ